MISFDFTSWLASIALMLPAFLVALSFHEFFHALAATALGDPTPRQHGRLTLNPLAHVDFLGLFFLLLFKIGWAKPVPFDHRNFKYPRLGAVITAFAGPFANFLMALFVFYLLKYLPFHLMSKAVALSFIQIFHAIAYVNIMLGVFNILPIPPLDGSHIIIAFMADKYPNVVDWLYKYSLFILLFLFLLPATRNIFVALIAFAHHFLKMLVV